MSDTTAAATPPEEGDNDIRLVDLLQVALENIRLLVLVPLAAGLVALGVSFLIPPTYTARAAFIPPQQQSAGSAGLLAGLGTLGGLAGAAAGFRNQMDQYMSFLKSNSLEDVIIERFKLLERYDSKYTVDARRELEGNVRVGTGKDGIISVEFDDHDPAFAAEVANAYVEEFRKLLARLAVTEAQQRRMFFDRQLQATKANLVKAESALRAVGVSSTALKSNPTAAVAGVATLKAQVTAQEVKVASMRGFLTESSPELQRALAELAALRAQLHKQEREDTGAADSEAGRDYVARYREFKYHETLFDLYSRQFELARVDEAREGAVVQVLDVAKAPERKSRPKRALIAVGTTVAVGLLLLVFVLLRGVMRSGRGSSPADNGPATVLAAAWRRGMGLR
jgi:tyrosine-protein kinase Etk/Wzc